MNKTDINNKAEEIVKAHVRGYATIFSALYTTDLEHEVLRDLEIINEYYPECDEHDEHTESCEVCEQAGDYQEILEYIEVTSWLANELEIQGEPIIKTNGIYIWGRTTSGQAFYMDTCIQQIAENLI